MIAIKDLTLSNTDMTAVAAGVWRLVDPRITLASVASMFVGASAAFAAGDKLMAMAASNAGVFMMRSPIGLHADSRRHFSGLVALCR